MPKDAAVTVYIYTAPPAHLVALLRAHHMPHALPLLRRLRFTRFPGGISEHARVLYASADGRGPPEGGGTDNSTINSTSNSSSGGSGGSSSSTSDAGPFAAAYLDFSRGPETELWLYASLERRPDVLARGAANCDSGDEAEAEAEAAAECARVLLREVKRQRAAYARTSTLARPPTPGMEDTVLVGSLSEALRGALAGRGVVFPRVDVHDKWMFRADALPAADSVAPGLRWDAVRRADIPLMLSRTKINRKERTVILLPSMAIYRDDGTPVAWALLGPDSSLSCLHCEPEYRGRGFAKAVAVKLLRERLKEYDDDPYCWADVAPDNLGSQGVCKSLGGKIAWSISWSRIDLNKSFLD
ncbi:hypothetical protein AAE478_000978 [Parahypoxylon ruwenzoriense]